MRANGTVLWLDTALYRIHARIVAQLAENPTQRPLFENFAHDSSPTALQAHLAELYQTRLPFYHQAHYRCECD